MFDDVIKFSICEADLAPQPEHWQRESYAHRLNSILESVELKTGFPPSKNMRPIREGVFVVKDDTTIDDLVALGSKLRQWYTIDCFQCSIDRENNMAHMLFDWNDRETAKSVYINRSQQIAMSVMILRTLNLPRPEGTELWLRFFISAEYSDDQRVFTSILDQLKHAKLGRKNYHIARDVLTYVQQVCQGLVK